MSGHMLPSTGNSNSDHKGLCCWGRQDGTWGSGDPGASGRGGMCPQGSLGQPECPLSSLLQERAEECEHTAPFLCKGLLK